jgi:hypothetical protein
MRIRRHGDANATHRRGRKDDTGLTALARTQFPDRSPRTQARFARTMRFESFLRHLGEEGYLAKAITAATRRNGSLNFAKLERMMEYRVAVALEDAALKAELSRARQAAPKPRRPRDLVQHLYPTVRRPGRP